MKKAFISYRRQDSPGHVRAIHDRLRLHFHPDQIFMDVEDIPLGMDFVTVLDNNLSDCVVMIVMIGPGWLDIRSHSGSRRLDNPNDFVRLEIAQALARNISVIPILVDGALMPGEDDLPDVLKPLSRRQALELDNKHYDYGINTLTSELEKHLGVPPPIPTPDHVADKQNRLPIILGSIGLLLVSAILGLWLFYDTEITNKPDDEPGNKPGNKIAVQQSNAQSDGQSDNTTNIPTAAAGFDCNKASNDVEDAICNSDQTRKSDQQLNRVYRQLAQRIPPGAQQSLYKRQLSWVRQRNTHVRQNCFTQPNQGRITNCINNYYQQRISTLSRLPSTLLSRVKINAPPTNIRQQPNGDIVCQVQEKQMIEVYTDSVRERDGSHWYPTRVCGDARWGVVHESQISSVN